MRAPPAGEVRFRQHRELDRREDEAALERCDLELWRETVLVEQPADARRRCVVVRSDDDAIALLAQVRQLTHEPITVADDGVPAHCLDGRDARSFGRHRHRPCRRVGVGEQPIERHVQTRELCPCGVGSPRLRQRAGQIGFLGEDVGGAVAEPFGLDEDDLRVGRQEIEQHVLAIGEPRQPRLHAVECQSVGETLPLLAPPGLARDEPVGALADLVARQELPTREDDHAFERVRRALIAHRELAEAIDLVAPQVDAHGGVGGRREDVDDRAADGDLAAMFHLFLTAVARLHERGHELVAIATLSDLDLDRFDLLDVRPEALRERPDRSDHHVGCAARIEQPPDRAQPPAHRLDPGAHPLERQRLPSREEVDPVRTEKGAEVVRQPLAVRRRRDRNEVRATRRGGDEPSDGERSSRLRYGDERVRPPPNFQQGGVIA